mgnify:CR=1 FL=1
MLRATAIGLLLLASACATVAPKVDGRIRAK